MELKKSRLVEFGPFQADFHARLLLRDGQVVPLPPKAFDVLLALGESEGRAVTRDELMTRVWGDAFVEEGNLTQMISVLRKALGDDAQESRYVVTIPRRGYRFGMPIQEVLEPSLPEDNGAAASEQEVIERIPPRHSRALVWAAAVSAVVLTAAGSWLLRGTGASEPVRSLVVLPFVNLTGDSNNEYFSDGLTEEIINAVSGVRGLRVVARTTAFQFKGKAQDIRKIGEELRADAVLEGSVRW